MSEVRYPRINIICATFNAAPTLEKTIENVAGLKDKNVGLIIVDGNSTDGTQDVIKRNERLVYKWISEKDKGIYDAFNKGWQMADADAFILYLGAGDTILQMPAPEAFADCDVLFGDVIIHDKMRMRSKLNSRLKLGNSIHHQAEFVRKAVHPDPPFNLRYRIYADFDFNQRLMKKNVRFRYASDLLSYALPGGVSERYDVGEMARVVKGNFGTAMSVASAIYCRLQYVNGVVQRFLRRGSVR